MSEVPAGWVSPLIQQLTTATFHTVAKAMCHKVTTVVAATLLPREGSGGSCSLLGRTAGNRIFRHYHRKMQHSALLGCLLLVELLEQRCEHF